MTKKGFENTKRKTKEAEFIPNELEEAIGVTGEEAQNEIFDFAEMCYVEFLLFYKYLKTAKIGRPHNGGWITNEFRIEQRGEEYKIITDDTSYVVSKESCVDLTEFIKLYL